MPDLNDGIVSLVIKVNLKTNPSFDVMAGDKPKTPAKLDYFCNGGKGPEDAAFLKEILLKIVASYPDKPISLCIDKPTIVPGALCAAKSLDTEMRVEDSTAKPPARKKTPKKSG